MKEQNILKDPYNIIITGVGGQGSVMASRVLSNMLSLYGFKITIGETFGASQRGGSVMSHIRVSGCGTWSPQIPKGRANLVVALEPVESLRVLMTYGNPEICILANIRPTYPVGVIAGDLSYPEPEDIDKTLHTLAGQVLLIDATKEAVELGNPILSNIIMIGAVCGLGLLPIGVKEFRSVIQNMIPAKHLEINVIAFELGQRKSIVKIE